MPPSFEMNSTSMFDSLETPADLNCFTLKFVAFLCCCILVLSLLFNSLILVAFYRLKKIQHNFEKLIIALAILSLMGTAHLPFIIHANYACKWIGGQTDCNLSSFAMFFVATSSIYLLTCITFERYYMISNPHKNPKVATPYILIALSVSGGLIWSGFPLIGWSRYTLEPGLTHCSVDWASRTLNGVSYNITIFLCVFILPLLLILITSYKLLNLIKESKGNISRNGSETVTDLMITPKKRLVHKKSRAEKRVTFNLCIFSVGFILTWLPYGLVSMYSAFVNPHHIPPVLRIFPAIFGKSSLFGSTAYYLLSNENLMKSLGFQRQPEKRRAISLTLAEVKHKEIIENK